MNYASVTGTDISTGLEGNIMDNTLYIALSRQTALMRQLDVVSNNVANANTTGFRSQRSLFEAYVVDANKRMGSDKLAYTQDIATAADLSPGPLVQTSRAFDVAILGKGMFAVQAPGGVLYTRAGNFQVDGNGFLTTAQGYPVLGQGGQQIVFDNLDGEIVIGESGSISIGGQEVAQLEVLGFDDEQVLQKVGNALFKSDVPGAAIEESRIVQGSLEGSNVNSVAEMTNMIEVSRNISSITNIISAVDDLQLTAIRTLAKQQ